MTAGTPGLGRRWLDRLWARGRDFLGTELAIMGGAMTWVSERNLVAAISNGGGFGVIACGSMTAKLLDEEIAATKALTKKPFGVNLITLHPDLIELVDVCTRHKVGHVVLAGALPPPEARKNVMPTTRSRSTISSAAANACVKKNEMIDALNAPQTKIGRRNHVMPGARM